MKILIITNMYPSKKKPYYGIFIKNQVRCLINLNHDVKVICDRGEGNDLYQLFIKYFLIGLKSIYYCIIKKPDIIHAHYIFPPGFFAMICSFILRSPLLITSHRGDVFDMPYTHRIMFILTRLCLLRANKIVAVSSEIKMKLNFDFNIDINKISIIDMGVDTLISDRITNSSNNGQNTHQIRILFVGSSFKRKGGYTLLKAAKIIKNKLKDNVKYDFIGEKPELIDLNTEKMNLSEDIRFHGFLTHLETMKLMKKSDIFVLPSLSEGLPISMLEAMSFGLCTILTPVGDIPSVIQNEKNGLLIPVGDYRSLAEAIIKLINDKKLMKKIGEAAKLTAEEYSSMKKATEIERLYNLALKQA